MLIVKRSFKEIERDLTMLKDHNFHNQQIREWKRPKKLRKKKLNKKPSLGLTSIFFFKMNDEVIRVNKTLNEAKETNTQKKKHGITILVLLTFVITNYWHRISCFKFLIEWRYLNSYRKTPLTERPSVNFLI